MVYLNIFVLSLVIQLVKLFGLFLFIGLQAVFLILITSVNSQFFDCYSNLLGFLSDQNFETHILMDSNIDLLKVNINPGSKLLIDLIFYKYDHKVY